ncbi:hypothetical protein [Sphingobium chungangianum]
MERSVDLRIDVSDAAGLGMAAHMAVTVHLPNLATLNNPTTVCFAFPGGGYCRRYFSFDMPDGSGGGQAGFHCERGWIFVTCDHLGFGESTIPDGSALNLDNVAAANDAMVRTVMNSARSGHPRRWAARGSQCYMPWHWAIDGRMLHHRGAG